MFCRKCGRENTEEAVRCVACGEQLRDIGAPRYLEADPSLGGLIPYRNPAALWAYYLGVFSLLPLFGIPLGIAAAILGLVGLRFAREHAEARGRVHAWVGLLTGAVFGGGQLALAIGWLLSLF